MIINVVSLTRQPFTICQGQLKLSITHTTLYDNIADFRTDLSTQRMYVLD